MRRMQVSRRSSKERGYQANDDNSDLDVINYVQRQESRPASSVSRRRHNNSGSRSNSNDFNVWHPADNRISGSLEHRDKMHTLPDRSSSALAGPMKPVLRDPKYKAYAEYTGLHSHSTEVRDSFPTQMTNLTGVG